MDRELLAARLLDRLVDHVVIGLDPTGVVRAWSLGAEKLTGRPAGQVEGVALDTLFVPRTGDLATLLADAGRHGVAEIPGAWLVHPEGRSAGHLVARPLGAEGGVDGFVVTAHGCARGTTARESDEPFRLLVEGVKDYAIFLLDPEGRIASWNLGAQRIKGYSADEILGAHFSRFYTPDDIARRHPWAELEAAIEVGRYEEEGWRVRKDGSRFWANVVITALRAPDGTLRGFAKVTRDMTERRAAERKLQAMHAELERRVEERTRQLQEANEELHAFARTVAHDLRAPLRAMQGYADALLEDLADALGEQGREYASRIAGSAARMDRLIQALLAYAQLGRAEVPISPVSLDAALDVVLARLEERGAPGAPGDLRAVVRAARPLGSVLGAEPLVASVLQNLIGNALKFTRPGERPRVRVSTERHGAMLRCLVRDEGIGIAPEHHRRIFRVFERLHGADAYPGTGVGLATVARSIALMGGAFGVESAVGRGSTFWFELPVPQVEER